MADEKDILLQYGTGEEWLVPVKEGGLAMEEPVTNYPFALITEIYQAGKEYGGAIVETAKNVISYPYEKVVEALYKEEPTGVIKSENPVMAFLNKALKPPWIFLVLGGVGIWLYSSFRKR